MNRKLIAVAVLSILMAGCKDKALVRTEPPPGFTIVCDIQRGLYAPEDALCVFPGVDHKDRQSAINHAWTIYEMRNKPGKQRNWTECDDSPPAPKEPAAPTARSENYASSPAMFRLGVQATINAHLKYLKRERDRGVDVGPLMEIEEWEEEAFRSSKQTH